MSTYVISDIHGCFNEFQQMLDKIGFSDDDILILAGDYIDRGDQSVEMLRWLMKKPDNVCALKGNHDVEYCGYVNQLENTNKAGGLEVDYDLPSDLDLVYQATKYSLKKAGVADLLDVIQFDYYVRW